MLQTFAGGRVFGSRSGHGAPAVVALHGWARTQRDFDAVLRPPDAGAVPGPDAVALDAVALDALALDLPGFGATPPPAEPWGSPEYAECVSSVLEDLDAPVVIAGHSFGGRVAVHLAARHPDQVRALVLTGVPLIRLGPRRRPARAYRVIRGLHRARLVSDARLDAARERYGSADFRAAQGIMRQVYGRIVAETYEEQLDALRCPVTFVWGDDDATVPLAVAEAAMARVRDSPGAGPSELVVCPGAGHLLPLTAPGALRQAIRHHLA